MQWLFNSKPKIVCIHSSGSTTKITYHFTGWFVMRLCCLSYSWWWISPLAIVIVKFSSNNQLFQFTTELCILNHTALIPLGVFWKTLLLKNSHSIELGYNLIASECQHNVEYEMSQLDASQFLRLEHRAVPVKWQVPDGVVGFPKQSTLHSTRAFHFKKSMKIESTKYKKVCGLCLI